MGTVRIRHYRVRRSRGYWEPTAKMKAMGFRVTPLGPDGTEAWTKAERLNAEWDKTRKTGGTVETYPEGTLGWVFTRYRTTGVWATKEPRTREEWELAWAIIKPVFADVPVKAIEFTACDTFYTELRKAYSTHKKHRVFKIFRALLEVSIGMQQIDSNPTHKIANAAPAKRKATWHGTEVVKLRVKAWDLDYRGLAVAIAIAYDTQMAPVDVRRLALSMRRHDKQGDYFETSRKKTGKDVIGTLSKGTVALLDRYLAGLGFVLPRDQPFVRNRSGHVYCKDTLGDDFRVVRDACFPADTRRLMDMRRSGNVEAVVGGAEATHLSAKLSNTLAQSNQIHDTYSPVQLAAVREADKARVKGRRRLKLRRIADELRAETEGAEENESGKFPTRAPVSESEQPSKTRFRKRNNG